MTHSMIVFHLEFKKLKFPRILTSRKASWSLLLNLWICQLLILPQGEVCTLPSMWRICTSTTMKRNASCKTKTCRTGSVTFVMLTVLLPGNAWSHFCMKCGILKRVLRFFSWQWISLIDSWWRDWMTLIGKIYFLLDPQHYSLQQNMMMRHLHLLLEQVKGNKRSLGNVKIKQLKSSKSTPPNRQRQPPRRNREVHQESQQTLLRLMETETDLDVTREMERNDSWWQEDHCEQPNLTG